MDVKIIPCPICGSSRVKIEYNTTQLKYYAKCMECNTLQSKAKLEKLGIDTESIPMLELLGNAEDGLSVSEWMNLERDTPVMVWDKPKDKSTPYFAYFCDYIPSSCAGYPIMTYSNGDTRLKAEFLQTWKHGRLATQEEIERHEE